MKQPAERSGRPGRRSGSRARRGPPHRGRFSRSRVATVARPSDRTSTADFVFTAGSRAVGRQSVRLCGNCPYYGTTRREPKPESRHPSPRCRRLMRHSYRIAAVAALLGILPAAAAGRGTQQADLSTLCSAGTRGARGAGGAASPAGQTPTDLFCLRPARDRRGAGGGRRRGAGAGAWPLRGRGDRRRASRPRADRLDQRPPRARRTRALRSVRGLGHHPHPWIRWSASGR